MEDHSSLAVTIIVPVHNRLDLTRAMLDSLWPTLTADLPTEVIFFDDHSSDGTGDFLARFSEQLSVIRTPERGWFSRNINIAACKARGRWICPLNNDVLLTQGWLHELVHCAKEHPNAYVIGNYHRFPQTGRVNHCGIVFDAAKNPIHLYLGRPDRSPGTEKTRRMQTVSAACWLTPRDLFHQLGGFDESYRNGCEDLDYCFKANKAGGEVWYCGTSRIDHYGQSTPGRLDCEEANARLFLERWSSSVENDLEFFPKEDGVAWPPGSMASRIARATWRSPVIAPFKKFMLKSAVGVRLRQKLLGLFQN